MAIHHPQGRKSYWVLQSKSKTDVVAMLEARSLRASTDSLPSPDHAPFVSILRTTRWLPRECWVRERRRRTRKRRSESEQQNGNQSSEWPDFSRKLKSSSTERVAHNQTVFWNFMLWVLYQKLFWEHSPRESRAHCASENICTYRRPNKFTPMI